MITCRYETVMHSLLPKTNSYENIFMFFFYIVFICNYIDTNKTLVNLGGNIWSFIASKAPASEASYIRTRAQENKRAKPTDSLRQYLQHPSMPSIASAMSKIAGLLLAIYGSVRV